MKKPLLLILIFTFAILLSISGSAFISSKVNRDCTTTGEERLVKDSSQYQNLARDIFKELIEINTTSGYGSTKAAEDMV